MRIVSWNMRKATKKSPAWEYLLSLKPDLALLQEVSSIPPQVQRSFHIDARRATGKSGGPQRFSTAVMVRGAVGPPLPLASAWQWVNEELRRFDGNLVATMGTLHSGEQLRVLSAYSPAWPVSRERLVGIDPTPVKTELNPDVWVADLLLAALRSQHIGSTPAWVVGGDLNSSETFDYMWGPRPRGNRENLDRMHSLGLTECLRHANGKLVPTFRNPRGGKIIHQMDHLFVQTQLVERLIRCVTGDPDQVFGQSLSDHLPIIADFAN